MAEVMIKHDEESAEVKEIKAKIKMYEEEVAGQSKYGDPTKVPAIEAEIKGLKFLLIQKGGKL